MSAQRPYSLPLRWYLGQSLPKPCQTNHRISLARAAQYQLTPYEIENDSFDLD
jgi:hypothetical protein